MTAPSPNICVYASGPAPTPTSNTQVRQAIDTVIARIGMTKFGPFTFSQEGDTIVAIQMIAESHVVYHEKAGYRLFEVFSCAPFPEWRVLETLVDLLGGHWYRISAMSEDEQNIYVAVTPEFVSA